MKIRKIFYIVGAFALIGTVKVNAATIETTLTLPIDSVKDVAAPEFDENTESLYYMDDEGKILDSDYNEVDGIPETLKVRDLVDEFSGIGVYMTLNEQGNIVFIETMPDTPAAEVIEPNDILLAVDGEDVTGQTTEYVATKIKGLEGTSVHLDIIRNGENMSFDVKRQNIKLYSGVEYEAQAEQKISSIDKTTDNITQIVYSVADKAGNISKFVINAVVKTIQTVMPDGIDEQVEQKEDLQEDVQDNEEKTQDELSETNEVEIEKNEEIEVLEENI